MSQTARKWFLRRAKQYGLDTSTGSFGEWLNEETRKCWYFWIMSWQLRARDIKKRAGKGKPEVQP